MAQDLASLVIGLRADVAQLQSDLGKANALNARYAREASDTWTKAAGEIGQVLGAAVIAFAGIGATLAKQAIDAADGFNKMSQKVGISVESLSALNVQAKLADVATDQLQSGLAKLARNAADAAAGGKQNAAAFAAMGVSLKDSNGNLKSTQDILQAVAAKFAQYGDSAEKTALAQQLFGKSGAELIPLLNQLGAQGFAKAREEAEKYGAVISTDMAQQSEQFNDNLTRIKLETEGFANAVSAQLLPGLIKLSQAMVDAGTTTDRYGGSATTVSNAVKGLVLGLITVKEFLTASATVTFAFFDAVKTTFSAAGEFVGIWAAGVYKDIQAAFTIGGPTIAEINRDTVARLSAVAASAKTAFVGIKDALAGGLSNSVTNVRTAFDDLFGTFSNVSSGANTTAKSLGNLHAPLVENAADAEKAQKALEDYAKAQNAAGAFIAKLQGGLDPLDKAYQDYVQNVLQANKVSQDLIATGTKAGKATEAYAAAQAFMAKAVGLSNGVLDEQIAKLAQQGDVLGRVKQGFADQTALIGLTDRERFITEAVQKATDEWNANTRAHIANKQSLEELTTGTAEAAAATFDLTEAAKNSRSIAQEFANIWVSAGNSIADAFSKWVVEGGSLMDSLVSTAKQVVEQIIAQFVRLSVLNPILNAIFGTAITGGGSLLPTFASAASAFAGGDSGFNMGGPSGATSAAGNAGLFGTAQQGYSLFNMGKKIWDGFSSGFSGSGYTGTWNMGGPSGTGITPGYQSGFGQALGIAGGVYAGYNRFQQAGGGLGGVAGGAAYGYGTYAAGAGIATLAATGSITAGLAAIGPIGWVAIGLMAIDTLSGGKLFGTKGKFNFGEQAITVGAGGATVTAGYDLKGQSALFGGSTHAWQTLVVDPAAQAAADAFFDQLKKGTDDFAKEFGKTAGALVGGQFIATFDKHGNVTGTTSTVAGHTYSGETQEQFQERLVAENELSVLGQFDDKLAGAIDKYRSNADELYAITNDLATAQKGFNDGLTFLALGADQSTSALLALAEASQQMGETIDQTIQRIMQAQGAYDQFVAQFKPATNYVDDFEKALSDINATMLANIKQANDLARAAGAAGASEQDLANIHAYAAQQAAAALQALQNSAQSLAFDLGLTTTGSLEQVNSEIERLQAKANAGASAVHGFGSAMQDAADNAKHAMDLLLGDLSPLNDQQKLQKALEGLRAGTVTQEQVLEIGRRLYGSTQPYNALFAMVQQMGHTAAVGTGGGGIGASGGGGLTGAERDRLNQLLKEQASLQASATLTQYQTLAQQIAEIASAQGVDWRTVLQNMGINIKDFEAGLKLNDQQTSDYIAAIQTQTDDNGENTQSLIEALDRNTAALDRVSGYQGGDPGDVATMGGGTTGRTGVVVPRGHGQGRTLTPEDADMIGRSVAQHSRGMNGRSSRPPTAASTAR